jgi:hypothetical protein
MEKPKNNIIGIAGRMNSGKGVLAQWLHRNYGYVSLESADKLKETCTEFLGLDSVDELNELKKSGRPIGMYCNKDVCKRLAKAFNIEEKYIDSALLEQEVHTVRTLLQKVGTDVLRQYDPDWHINQLCVSIIENVKNGLPVVIGDVRFPNEKARIEGLGGIVYYINRDIESDGHESENALSPKDFSEDRVIENDGTVDELIEKFKQTIMGNQ